MSDLLKKAAELEQRAADSFERCDTDGFVSQWAAGIEAQRLRAQAEIEANGGMAEFDALFDLAGNEVPAKLIRGKFGLCWALCDNAGQFTGTFITAFPAKPATMARKGYREGKVTRPAMAVLQGSGKGLAGAASVRVAVVERKR